MSLFVGDDGEKYKVDDCGCGHGKVKVEYDGRRHLVGRMRNGLILGAIVYRDAGRGNYAFSCMGCNKDLDFETVKKRHVKNLNRLEI